MVSVVCFKLVLVSIGEGSEGKEWVVGGCCVPQALQGSPGVAAGARPTDPLCRSSAALKEGTCEST